MSQSTDGLVHLALKPDGMGSQGEATAEYDGMRVRVFAGIPGEEVQAEVIRRHRDSIAARVSDVIVPSDERVQPPCPYFGWCTGCQWQHVRYDHQLELKRRAVLVALERGGGVLGPPVAAVVPAPDVLGYRNHARFTVGPQGSLGFVNRDSRRFVRVDRCLLMHPWINQALSLLQDRCAETTQLSIRYGVNTGKWLIQPALKTRVPLASGQKCHEEALLGRVFRVSASSFFQVNTLQAEGVAQLVRDRLSLSGTELVVDAYAGVGTFAVLLAPFADRVIAIEDSASAVQDAEVNIRGLANVELARARTEEMLDKLGRVPDAMVLDPPRAGCHPTALHAVLRRPPQRLVYVSCDPWALARDLQVLLSGPYKLEEVQPIDLFPQTHHIECIATLSLDTRTHRTFQRRQRLVLASESPRRQRIMREMGLVFEVVPSDLDEPSLGSGDPAATARERALHKARVVAATLQEGTVIGADTVVACGDEILGKPGSEQEARDFLRRLCGREHRVITGLALVDAATGQEVTDHRRSRVHMRRYTDPELEAYVGSGDPLDKAGAYAIQDAEFRPVDWMKGCYLNVVGLPPCTLVSLLHRMGIYPAVDPGWIPPGNCPDCHRLSRMARGK